MDSIQIEGGIKLYGQTKIQGSKNAALPILAASILIYGETIIENCPKIDDVFVMIELLKSIGCKVLWKDRQLSIYSNDIKNSILPKNLVEKMRSSIILLGALLGRTGSATMDYPGGCVIGKRPVDIHFMALRSLGATITEENGSIHAVTDSLRGNRIVLPICSVGATQNCILASICAEGSTQIINAAKEPEIQALCEFLINAGANIQGSGTNLIIVNGKKELHSSVFRIPSDRIVAGTYAFAGLINGGELRLMDSPCYQMQAVISVIRSMGAEIIQGKNEIVIRRKNALRSIPLLKTQVYPGFPTDLQSILLVACTAASGKSMVEETIFENRFKIVEELRIMGASIEIEKSVAHISGGKGLQGAKLEAKELRGGAALVLAGTMAEGITVVENKHFIERGYENICQDLRNLGARISVI